MKLQIPATAFTFNASGEEGLEELPTLPEAEGDGESFELVDDYSEVDSNYEPIPDPEDEESDTEEEIGDEETEEELAEPEVEEELLPYWARYELHGRNLDEQSSWSMMAEEEYTGELEVAVEGLTAGARWEFRIRLVDRNGRYSRWSDALQIVLPTDFTPPPRPVPPEVVEKLGLVAITHTTELEGEKPRDFSHVKLYAQQMHPPGDPDGEPGDPRLIAQFYEESSTVVGDFFDGVVYRVWATAVDTTGNESPWSDTVEVTPTLPFDDTELQEALRELNEEILPELRLSQEEADRLIEELNSETLPKLQEDLADADRKLGELAGGQENLRLTIDALDQGFAEAVGDIQGDLQNFQEQWDEHWDPEAMDELRGRQDTLEGDLTTGLDNVYTQAQQLATAAENNAVTRAASDAQSEYDRLQRAADEALESALFGGGNLYPDPSFELGGRGLGTWTRGEIVEDSRARHGTHVVRVTAAGGSIGVPLQRVSVGHGSWAYLELWFMRTSTSQTGSIAMRLQAENQDGGASNWSVGTTSIDDAPLNEWIKVSGVRQATHSTAPRVGWRAYPFVTGGNPAGVLIDSVKHLDVSHAQEALQAAQAAQQSAEAAHVEAGNARDLAVTAQDTASGKADIIRQTTAPTGTAPEGSIWFRYDNMTASRRLIGWWVRESGAWRSQEMDETILPLVNIGIGTYGDLSGDRLEAHTVRTNHLLVGPRNIITDPEFETLDNDDFRSWRDISGAFYLQNVSWSNRPFARLSQADSESSTSHNLTYGGNSPSNSVIPCEAGDVFKVRFQVLMYAGDGDLEDDNWQAQIRWSDPGGTGISWTTHQFQGALSRVWEEFEAEAPEGATRFYLRFRKVGASNRARGVGNVSLEKMADSSLIVRGAVKAEHVDSQSLTASDAFLDSAMVNLIQGRMANFDEAIIGGALLKDNSVSVGKLSVIPNVTDYAPDPGEFPELWDLRGASIVSSTGADDNPSNVAFQFNQRSGDTQVRGPVRPVTPGKQIRFRGRYTGWGSGTSGSTVRVRMEWSGGLTPGRDGYSTFLSIPTSASLGWYSGTVTVPEWAEYGRLYLYQASNSGRDMGFRGSIQCEPMVGSVLIEDGAVMANAIAANAIQTEHLSAGAVTANEIAANAITADHLTSNSVSADAIAANAVRAAQIQANAVTTAKLAADAVTADKIAANSIGADHIVSNAISADHIQANAIGANQIAANAVRASQIQAGAIDGMTITGAHIQTNGGATQVGGVIINGQTHTISAYDSEGELSLRLGRGTSSFIRGHLHAGPNQDLGVVIDYGVIGITSGWSDEEEPPEIIRESISPYIEFKADFNHLITPKMFVDEADGGLNISPGRAPGTASGSGRLRLWAHTHANKVITRHLEVPTSSGLQPGGLYRDGARTRLAGRTPDTAQSTDMIHAGDIGPYSMSTGRWRRTVSWTNPVPQGNRHLVATVRGTQASWDNFRMATVMTGPTTSSQFRFVVQMIEGYDGASVTVRYLAPWN